MKSTGRWVQVVRDRNDRNPTTRMLHKDRRGRECIRHGRQWRLVERQRGKNGYKYVIGGTI